MDRPYTVHCRPEPPRQVGNAQTVPAAGLGCQAREDRAEYRPRHAADASYQYRPNHAGDGADVLVLHLRELLGDGAETTRHADSVISITNDRVHAA